MSSNILIIKYIYTNKYLALVLQLLLLGVLDQMYSLDMKHTGHEIWKHLD